MKTKRRTLKIVGIVLLAAVLGHAAGVFAGSVTAAHVPQSLLKRGVAIFSICFSLFMLLK